MRPFVVVLIVLSLVPVVLLAACGVQRRLMFPRPQVEKAPILPSAAEQMNLGPGLPEAVLLPAAGDASLSPAVIFAHGNAELIDHWIRPFDALASAGIAVLLVEYPGYGRSAGEPTEATIAHTFIAAYDRLTERSDVDSERIVGYGRSLGGGAVCALARDRKLAGLILESTFTSTRDMALGFWMPPFLVTMDRFENERVVSRFGGSVLVLHGEHDRLIPVRHGEALAAAAEVPLVRMPCGHNDCPRPWRSVTEFVRAVGVGVRDGARP